MVVNCINQEESKQVEKQFKKMDIQNNGILSKSEIKVTFIRKDIPKQELL